MGDGQDAPYGFSRLLWTIVDFLASRRRMAKFTSAVRLSTTYGSSHRGGKTFRFISRNSVLMYPDVCSSVVWAVVDEGGVFLLASVSSCC